MQVLNAAEKAWVDAYHKEVWEKVRNAADVLLAVQKLLSTTVSIVTAWPSR